MVQVWVWRSRLKTVIRDLRLSLRIIPVHEGRLQGRSCKESPTVQLPKQRRVRLHKVG